MYNIRVYCTRSLLSSLAIEPMANKLTKLVTISKKLGDILQTQLILAIYFASTK